MKIVEISPKIEENPCGYKSRRKSPTGKISAMDIETAIRTSEYHAVKPEEFRVSVKVSPEEWEYINQYAEKENINMELAIQWFWTTGFKVLRNIHRMRETSPYLKG